MNKEELLLQIEKLNPEVNLVRENLNNKEAELITKIKEVFSDITDVDKNIRVDMNGDIYIEIELINLERKRIFGTSVDIRCRYDYSEKKDIIELNVGTCGSFTIDDIAQIKKYEMVSNFWKNYDKYSKVLINAREELKPYHNDFWNKVNEFNKLKDKVKQIENEEESASILNSIKVGNNYDIKCSWNCKKDWFKGNDLIVVEKITDKSILVTYKCRGYTVTENGRINKSDFVWYIKEKHIRLVKEN